MATRLLDGRAVLDSESAAEPDSIVPHSSLQNSRAARAGERAQSKGNRLDVRVDFLMWICLLAS